MSASEKRRWPDLSLAQEGRISDHLLDWLNSGNGLLRERESESYRTQELSVNIDRATAHPLHDTGLLERASAEFSQYDDLSWSEVFEDTEDLDLELFDLVAMEDSTTGTL